MSSGNVSYAVSQGFRFFLHNKVMSLASICVLASCLFIISNFFLISLNLQENIKVIEDKNEVSIFLNDDLTESDLTYIKLKLESIENIKTFEYVTKEQALEEYKALYADQQSLFADLEKDNPLPAYFRITMKDIRLFDETLAQLKSLNNISSIRSQEDLVDAIITSGNVISNVSIWIMGIMLVASLFIIVNTIRLAFFSFRRQINIMKYIGATNWFIRWPFIVEGTIIGIIAGAIAFLLQWYAYSYAFQSIAKSLSFVTIIPFDDVIGTAVACFIGAGMAIGVVGSAISIRKHLKV